MCICICVSPTPPPSPLYPPTRSASCFAPLDRLFFGIAPSPLVLAVSVAKQFDASFANAIATHKLATGFFVRVGRWLWGRLGRGAGFGDGWAFAGGFRWPGGWGFLSGSWLFFGWALGWTRGWFLLGVQNGRFLAARQEGFQLRCELSWAVPAAAAVAEDHDVLAKETNNINKFK